MKHLAAITVTLAVERVLGGKIWLSDEMREELGARITPMEANGPDSFHGSSDRKVTVYWLVGKEMEKSEIAKALINFSPTTVETYRSNISRKWGLLQAPGSTVTHSRVLKTSRPCKSWKSPSQRGETRK